MKRADIREVVKERILILDGAMGTMIQRMGLTEQDFRGERFAEWEHELIGCNDVLVLTKPSVISDIHRQYLEAGADIITSCTFNGHTSSIADYGLEALTYEMGYAGAHIARELADEFTALNPDKRRFVAGSIGPTNKTCSISADVLNPASRETDFDTLSEGYMAQLRGLIAGGADLILIETIFDALNAKAALYAIDKVGRELGREIPVMASGTLADASGRTLTGQTVEAFYTSLSHVKLLSIGLNCAHGAKQMLPYLEQMSKIAECAVSAYPNAGLPNVMGGYDETPEMFAADVEEYMQRGVINIIGGCCGTTPDHIKCLNALVDKYSARRLCGCHHDSMLSGLEPLKISKASNFINIGERGNVAGSAKFARLIRERNFDEALSVIRAQVDAGAQIVDICMDDGLIDALEVLPYFLNLMASEPEIARVPVMIDSSKWEVLVEGLKRVQGKSIVNSISLKEGEEVFVDHAAEIHRMGAAAVVMLFDEQGQADSYERKIEIAERAYRLLTQAGFPAEDIIFDCNVLAVATGIEEHDSYAKAFIDATRWIKENLPYAKVSGGVSNLSFSFRGNNKVREAMHSVFLYHAIEAGLDMAIVNAQQLQIYDQIEPTLRECIEDIILCRRADAAERLTELAQHIKEQQGATTTTTASQEQWRELPLKERIQYAMSKGLVEHIEEDTEQAYRELGTPMAVIDNMLMPAMEYVGQLFGQGQMFLPQVVKTARVMKRAVGVLTPYIENDSTSKSGAKKVLIATVKGDVHDIGKNIVAVVMACNGYEIIDLGVMVETNKIVDQAQAQGADVICMSGLITPSLDEMIRVAQECERRGMTTPIVIGGATTSPMHTAVKIAPHYSGVVVHANNASDNPKILSQILGDEAEQNIAKIKERQAALVAKFEQANKERELIPYGELARVEIEHTLYKPNHMGRVVFSSFEIESVEELIDWNFFFSSWGIKGRYPEVMKSEKYGAEATKLFNDGYTMLGRIKRDGVLKLQGVVAIMEARGQGNDIVVTDPRGRESRLPMLRNQRRGERNISLADYLTTEKGDHIALFALTAGIGLEALTKEYREAGDEYSAMMAKLLADRLTEAFAQQVHNFVRREMWGFEGKGARLAFGYPAVPDHSLKKDIFKLLNVEMMTEMKLSENYMITPAEALCGVIIPCGEFFSVGEITQEQLADYASRRGVSEEQVRKLIPNNVL